MTPSAAPHILEVGAREVVDAIFDYADAESACLTVGLLDTIGDISLAAVLGVFGLAPVTPGVVAEFRTYLAERIAGAHPEMLRVIDRDRTAARRAIQVYAAGRRSLPPQLGVA